MDKAEVIFEAFRQADGTTSRKYGGTGLGLAISRDFARLLGGELSATSEPMRGSTFHLELPTTVASGRPARPPAPRAPVVDARGPGDRSKVVSGNALLIVEDDRAFANILADLATELGYRPVIAETAEAALQLASASPPRAILLDIRLPDQSGLGVLDVLKRRPETRHIPVHVISSDDHADQALALGAAGAITKPVSREELVAAVRRLESFADSSRRRLLLVEDDAVQRDAVATLLGGPDLEIVGVSDAAAAIAALRDGTFDCMVTDLGLPDASGLELLQTIAEDDALSFPPVIVYTGRELSADDQDRLRRLAPTIIVKGARSPERLLDEVSLFLHRVESALPADRQLMLRRARDQESGLVGRTILVVEDDVRNIFALSSALEPKGCKVVIARNGVEAIEQLQNHLIDLVLMDIMMPVMDGLEAMRRIRKMPDHARLPIIALTAKAMPDDRERCIAAGANDYITKPLALDRLLSLVRVWLRPEGRA
jgi:CheY-like chemotaxis protein